MKFHINKIFIITVTISIAAHAAVLSVPIAFRSQAPNMAPDGIMNAELKSFLPSIVEPPPEKRDTVKPSSPKSDGGKEPDSFREETVTLGSKESKYRDYLKKVKDRIESRWTYPGKAFERGEKGVTTVRFSIDQNGALSANTVINTSGYGLLDEGAMNVISSAAPYDPLPAHYNLSRLHIIASFHYSLTR